MIGVSLALAACSTVYLLMAAWFQYGLPKYRDRRERKQWERL